MAIRSYIAAFLLLCAVACQRHGSLSPRSADTNAPAKTPAPSDASPTPGYPIGVWGAYGGKSRIPAALVANKGVVGVGISETWANVNPSEGTYAWATLDDRIAQAKAAGFKVNLSITNSSSATPLWLLAKLPADQKINLLDSAPNHSTFCQPIVTALYWNADFHKARLDLIAAAGAHFASDPGIVAVTIAFANHNSNDWNIQDTVGNVCGQDIDQPKQWLDAGWSEAQMLQVGKDICDAAATAFPSQNIKMPIGVLGDARMNGGDQTRLARDITDYIYSPSRPYSSRFYIQRNSFAADWRDGTYWDTHTPDVNSDNYIKFMIRSRHHSGLQNIGAASTGAADNCRQGGGTNGPCGAACEPACVMRTSLDLARTYGITYYEIFQQDDVNPAFYEMIKAATIAMGGTPR